MNDTPSQTDSSSIPEAVRIDYVEWRQTGNDAILSRLIGHLFKSLEIENFDTIYAEKGDEAIIKDDFGIDSLTLAEIVFYTEDLLSIRIPNEDVAVLVSIGNLKSYLSKHRGDCSLQ